MTRAPPLRMKASGMSPQTKYPNRTAVLFGYFVWGDIPDAFILSGGALVIASGLYILHRETQRKRSA